MTDKQTTLLALTAGDQRIRIRHTRSILATRVFTYEYEFTIQDLVQGRVSDFAFTPGDIDNLIEDIRQQAEDNHEHLWDTRDWEDEHIYDDQVEDEIEYLDQDDEPLDLGQVIAIDVPVYRQVIADLIEGSEQEHSCFTDNITQIKS